MDLGSAPLKRRIRSSVKRAAIPDHRVRCCGSRVAAAPDPQAAVHSEASNAAIDIEIEIANRR